MTEPKPPASAATPALPSDDDIAACAPTATVRSATLCLMLAGFVTFLLGIQLVTSLRFHNALLQAALYAMVVVGLSTMVVGERLFRMRGWAAQVATGLAALLSITMSVWLLYSFSIGLFTLFALGAPPLSIGATYLAYRSIPAARRATEIRERLQDSGMELGF